MKKLLLSLSVITFLALTTTGISYGSYGSTGCQPIYGGGENCLTKGSILINKKVQNLSTNGYVDNLSQDDKRYAPNQNINFELIVTNTGEIELDNITVRDFLPKYLSFISGPGSYNADTNKITFTVNKLNPGETKVYKITAKVVENSLPANSGLICGVINYAEAESGSNRSDDNANFCIEKTIATTKGGLPVMDSPKGMTSTPATGPEMLPLLGLIPAAGAGLFLRRRSSK